MKPGGHARKMSSSSREVFKCTSVMSVQPMMSGSHHFVMMCLSGSFHLSSMKHFWLKNDCSTVMSESCIVRFKFKLIIINMLINTCKVKGTSIK